jgi:aerobic carbon-monoxide dehydrogenase medium subunit
MLTELGDEAKVLAGGHSLLPLMKLRFASPVALVDIGDVAELRFVERDGDQVRVGALTRHRDLAEHPVIQAAVPLLSATAAQIGDRAPAEYKLHLTRVLTRRVLEQVAANPRIPG